MKKGFRFALFALVVFIGFGYTRPAAAQDTTMPLLLVAVPDLGGFYAQTALIAIPAPNERHFGFILNRQTTMPLGMAFPSHAPSKKVTEHVFFGGPETPDALFALVRRKPEGPAIHLFDDVFATGNSTVIDQVIEKTPNDARYYLGLVVWQEGELQKELAAGFWYTAPASVSELFRKDTAKMWGELLERFGDGHPPAKGWQKTRFAP